MNEKRGNGMIVLIVVVFLMVICAGMGIGTYNKMISAQEKVTSSLADIDTQLQRRTDLIPNLVSSVKGYMEYEQSIIDSITESREKLVNATTLDEKAEANDALTEALNSFNVIVENYPDLKANTTFIQLQDELAGSENRIATARRDYNAAVSSYNQIIRKIPGSLFASMFGFEAAKYFEAAKGSDVVPTVAF